MSGDFCKMCGTEVARPNKYCSRACYYRAKVQIVTRERIEEMSMPVPFSGCWLWLGYSSQGYGQISHQGRMVGAHRVSYELHKGPVALGLFVCHACDVRCCVNPDHLFVGTNAENQQDAKAKGRLSTAPRYRGRIPFEMIETLRARVNEGEQLHKAARAMNISPSYASRLIAGSRRKFAHGTLMGVNK